MILDVYEMDVSIRYREVEVSNLHVDTPGGCHVTYCQLTKKEYDLFGGSLEFEQMQQVCFRH